MTAWPTAFSWENSRETAGYAGVGLAVWPRSEGADFEPSLAQPPRAPAGLRKGTREHRSPGYWSPNIAETRRKPRVVTGCSSWRQSTRPTYGRQDAACTRDLGSIINDITRGPSCSVAVQNVKRT